MSTFVRTSIQLKDFEPDQLQDLALRFETFISLILKFGFPQLCYECVKSIKLLIEQKAQRPQYDDAKECGQ